jgi:flagellar biosynthetic protein FliR
MPVSAHFSSQQLIGFLLTLTRVGAALILLPLPGLQHVLQTARIVLVVGTTFCLAPLWQTVAVADSGLGLLPAAFVEVTIGLLIGLTIAFVFEVFQIGAQIISFQAGFGFATTFDPQSQVDSGLLQTFTQLITGLLFFSLGIHGQVIRMLSRSFTSLSLETAQGRELSVTLIIHLGSRMFVDGIKLALPVVTLLFLVDLGLSALTRLQSQLQLLTLAFPAKVLLSIIFLSTILVRWSDSFQRLTVETFTYVFRLMAL